MSLTFAQRYRVGFIAFCCLLFTSCDTKDNAAKSQENLYKGNFGTCCTNLGDALNKKKIPNSFFNINENNILYQTVGYIDTDEGPGYFDQAVLFCPFCGKQLQNKDEIKRKAN
jgi:hypothetical protein